MSASGTHTEHEDHPWTAQIGDHPAREDSPGYRRSRALMIKLVQASQPWFLGGQPYHDHHGGGIWVRDDDGWLLMLGLAGVEWSAQFCADPAKVDRLRTQTARVVARFPLTLPGYADLGYHDAGQLLTTPVVDADGIAAWTDGIFNASVPLPAPLHTGTLPKAAGYHHYPKPIVDILAFKHDDFTLFVTDDEGQPAAVTPVGRRGSGDGRVAVTWATPNTALAARVADAAARGEQTILPPSHALARQAFVNQ